MPIPTPRMNESDDDFISRCMSDPIAIGDFPSEEQRFAVCSGELTQKADHPAGGGMRKKKKKKKKPRKKED